MLMMQLVILCMLQPLEGTGRFTSAIPARYRVSKSTCPVLSIEGASLPVSRLQAWKLS